MLMFFSINKFTMLFINGLVNYLMFLLKWAPNWLQQVTVLLRWQRDRYL